MDTPELLIIVASTRPNRIGLKVANWFEDLARASKQFEVKVADLKAINLPPLSETELPGTGKYALDSTKAWAKQVGQASAFALVFPEYNHSFPGTLKLALDTLGPEWRGKPVGLVSYGGVSGGCRAAMALVPTLNFLGLDVLVPQVILPFAPANVQADGQFSPPEVSQQAAQVLLAALAA
ncbi:MAG: NAD(P)H-dependent oxidoreductase [Micrococcales bacterium]|nr:NAD(P)H-dependent oxidoreductase [Micrococcales bacterium]